VLLVCFILIWSIQVLYAKSTGHSADSIELVLWVTSSILKILVLAILPIGLGAVYDSICARPKPAIIAGVVWMGIGLLLLTLLSIYRESWAQAFSSANYYSDGKPMLYGEEIVSHYNAWLLDWREGNVVFVEAILIISLAAGHAMIGYLHRGTLAAAITAGYLLTFVLLVSYVFLSDWVLIDYDTFHGDSFPSAVLFDHFFFPFASHPYTSIASIFYFACFVSNVFIVIVANPNERIRSDA